MADPLQDVDAFPLYWPEDRPRTPAFRRSQARFETSFAQARDAVIGEIRKLGKVDRGSKIVISTNLPLRRDGLPYADTGKLAEPGVAVYFVRDGKRVCFACDRWTNVRDNMQAIYKTIQAIRGIARWGTGDMIEAAFRGFMSLPGPAAGAGPRHWTDVLGVPRSAGPDTVRAAYKALAQQRHPDGGGTADAFRELHDAYAAAKRDLGVV